MAELTYGLERIALYLQDVGSFFDIKWNEQLVYGDVHHQSEVEYSKYHFEGANVETLFSLFDAYEKEALACLESGLILPVVDYVLKCSHTFNVLDARGVISVTERVGYIERVRRLAQRTARAYVAQREEMGHPLLNRWKPKVGSGVDEKRGLDSRSEVAGQIEEQTGSEASTDFLLEIGTEEIPAGYIPPVLDQFREVASQSLGGARLPFEDIRTLATPRRLTLWVKGLVTLQPDQVTEVVGPPKRVAYDAGRESHKSGNRFCKDTRGQRRRC